MDFHEFVPRRRNHWFLGNIQTRYGLYHVLCLVRLPQRNYRLEKTSHNRKAFSLTFTQEKELNRKRLKCEFHPASTRNSTRTVRANLWNAFTCSCSLGKLLSRDLFPSSPARTGGTLLAWDHALSQLTLYVSHGKRERNERKKQGSKEKKKNDNNAWSQVRRLRKRYESRPKSAFLWKNFGSFLYTTKKTKNSTL